ncbi:MAG: hypothetical protein F9K22_03805 [Bacteroidetes bacterium]|nr:MAG: hypothetical protein F9K22_03805 [Bacteroidota bacterium]
MSSKYLAILILAVCGSSLLFSQGQFLERGQNGFGIQGSFSSTDNATSLGGSLGYSASGVFDFGLSISSISFKEKLLGEDVSATALAPFIAIHAVKQNETTPISVSLSASYESDSYSSKALTDNRLELSATGYTIGATIYGNVQTTPTMIIQPSLGVNYFSTEAVLKDSFGNSVNDEETGTVVVIGLAGIFQSTPTTYFGISPSMSIHNDETAFGLRAGFIFRLN